MIYHINYAVTLDTIRISYHCDVTYCQLCIVQDQMGNHCDVTYCQLCTVQDQMGNLVSTYCINLHVIRFWTERDIIFLSLFVITILIENNVFNLNVWTDRPQRTL